ncbi:LytR/AlgR family response regulator transcription factor [Chryseolinea lacunae]|uniref:LytTR family transcriptional regulator DNA-binding domain-containing protein n=1 Tax=Chryseolinea lacunae TaxID=2801331 RepID=A0ABS1L288_9BACT|nr:LytTR family DNA-binding domain-containing protein [Chryseolinea lacunae]MBL0745632.1 LytTR family transcriptional regulator DNA-binding domain-containing protein [Chryseolinea lacunae]
MRRILEPVLLGSVANVIVNYLFNPHAYAFVAGEFVVACLLSVPITELNRYINGRLDEKMGWLENPRKRLLTHFALLALGLLLVLNVFGNGYMWIMHHGFFSWMQLLIINIVTLAVALFLTLLKWSVHFYAHWVRAERNIQVLSKTADELRQKVEQPLQHIEVQKGTARIRMEIQEILMAKIESGTVRLYSTSGDRSVYAGTLSQLASRLPDFLFFQVSRDAIVRREAIRSVAVSSFGKILLTTKEPNGQAATLTVSRPKAAAFRKWFNSNSA